MERYFDRQHGAMDRSSVFRKSYTLGLWLLQWKNQHRKKHAIHRVWKNVKILLLEIHLDCIINWKLFPPMSGLPKLHIHEHTNALIKLWD